MGKSRLTIWLWIALGLVLIVLSLPLTVGSLLRDDYMGHARAWFAAQPELVWKAIEDFRSNPLGGAAAKTVGEVSPEGALPIWLEEHTGRSIRVTTLEIDPGSRTLREMVDSEAQYSARWTIEVEPSGEGTEVRVHQLCTVQGGRIENAPLRFVMRFLEGAHRAPRSYLEELGRGLGVEPRFSE